jgi:hypothetical protein
MPVEFAFGGHGTGRHAAGILFGLIHLDSL